MILGRELVIGFPRLGLTFLPRATPPKTPNAVPESNPCKKDFLLILI